MFFYVFWGRFQCRNDFEKSVKVRRTEYSVFYQSQKCSNTTKLGFCKCRHYLTIKSIFLIFFVRLIWLCTHPNLKYERKLKIFKIFHKFRNFWVSNIPTLKFRDLWNILKIFCLRSYFKFGCVHSQIRRTKKIRKIDFMVN